MVGKKQSSRNALKHGILSSQLLVAEGLGTEDKQEFDKLLADLRQDWKPVGVMENLSVEEIAVSYWRLARVVRCESGEVGRNTHSVGEDYMASQIASITNDDPRLMVETSGGLQKFEESLDRATQELKSSGLLSGSTIAAMQRYFQNGEYGVKIGSCNEEIKKHWGKEDADSIQRRSEAVERMRVLLSICRQDVEKFQIWVHRKEHVFWVNGILAASLPNPQVTDQILRYQTAIERGLERAVNRLERLQMKRLGAVIPPTLKVQLEA